MPDNEGKPVDAPESTSTPGSEEQQGNNQPANPTVEVSDSVKSYLKGLGLEGATVTPELVKVAEAGMKQKESVSKLSFEKEGLLARLESQGKDTSDPQPEQTPETPTSEPAPQVPQSETNIGVSDNDLFDLSRMITTEFKELSEEAQNGSLFAELRQRGYFTSKGIDKKSVYEYLAQRNAQAQELRELREFKQKYGQPDPNAAPEYNAQPGINLKSDEKMTSEAAQAIILSGDRQNPRYNEAVAHLQQEALKVKTI